MDNKEAEGVSEQPERTTLPSRDAYSDLDRTVDPNAILHMPGGRYNDQDAKRAIEKRIIEQGEVRGTDKVAKANYDASSYGLYTKPEYADLVPDDSVQAEKIDGKTIAIQPVSPSMGDEKIVKGMNVARLIRSSISSGRPVNIPLHVSGFTIQVGNFTSISLFRLSNALKELRDNIGVNSRGLIFSGDSAAIDCLLTDYILEHVINTSVRGWTIPMVRKLMRIPDIESLKAGALDALYPKGYPFLRECANAYRPISPCDYHTLMNKERTSDAVALTFRFLVRRIPTRFQARHLRQLGSPWDALTEEMVLAYQASLDEHNGVPERIGPINNDGSLNTYIVPQIPSYELYRTEMMQWMANIEAIVDGVLTLDTDEMSEKEIQKMRNERISELINVVSAQKHSPWVKELFFESADGSMTAPEREDIINGLAEISARAEAKEVFVTAIEKFKVSQIHTFTGIPNYICPKCQESQDEDLHPQYKYIPINLVYYFFGIAASSHLLKI